MELLFVLILVLVFVALVGHGLWCAAAWLLRGGGPPRHRSTYDPTLNDDRAATARYLHHLHSRDMIDAETRATLMGLMAREAERVQPIRTDESRRRAKEAAETDSFETDDLADASPLVWPPRTIDPAGAWSRAKAPDQPPEVAPPPVARQSPDEPAPPAPRRSFGEVFAGFMAEKNIRWGELIGGLLILCCSTALVVSLWSQIVRFSRFTLLHTA